MSKTYAWYYDGAAIGGATSKTHTLTSGQTDSNLIECRVQVDYGTDSVAALAEYAAAAPSLTVTTLPLAYSSTATSTPEVTVDLSAYGAGDRVVVFYQTDDTQTTAARYNGSEVGTATQHIQQTVGNVRIAAWSFALSGAGGVSDTVGVTAAAGRNQHRFGFAVIEGGSVTGADEDLKQVTATDLATAVSVTNATNSVVSFAVATSQNGPFTTWTGQTEQASDQQPATTGNYYEIAQANNVSTGTHNVSVGVTTGAAGGADRALVTLLVE